ncbi:MAG TPA: complex I NDUFA9 subunit family protein [Gammaproteobacteria bacterium]
MGTKRICILGGTGFVGRHLAARLTGLGFRVRILSRNREKHRPLLILPLAEVHNADVYDTSILTAQFEGCDTVINLVGILNESGHSGNGFRKAHVELSRKVLEACKQSHVRQLLHMSALHADAARGPSIYLRTKGEAEDYLHTFHGNIRVTSFRPSVIFGPGDSFFNRFTRLLKPMPWLFPLACARSRFAPVYVGDIVEQFVRAIGNADMHHQRVDLCGPKSYTLKELVQYTSGLLGLKRWVVELPDAIAVCQAFIMDYFVPGKPFSLDNYHSLQIDNTCEHGMTLTTPIESVVPGYLVNKNQRNRYNLFRQEARR